MPTDTLRLQCLELLEDSIHKAVEVSIAFHSARADLRNRFSASLYSSVVALADGVLTLGRHGSPIGIPTIARQLLDAFIDLANVLHNDRYHLKLELRDHVEWKQLLERGATGNNTILKDLGQSTTSVENRKVISQRIKELVRSGISAPEVKERFRSVGELAIYESIYKLLSACAHNNMSMLLSRHDAWTRESPNIDLIPQTIPFEIASYIHCAQLVTVSARRVDEFYGNGTATGFDDLLHRAEVLDTIPP